MGQKEKDIAVAGRLYLITGLLHRENPEDPVKMRIGHELSLDRIDALCTEVCAGCMVNV